MRLAEESQRRFLLSPGEVVELNCQMREAYLLSAALQLRYESLDEATP